MAGNAINHNRSEAEIAEHTILNNEAKALSSTEATENTGKLDIQGGFPNGSVFSEVLSDSVVPM